MDQSQNNNSTSGFKLFNTLLFMAAIPGIGLIAFLYFIGMIFDGRDSFSFIVFPIYIAIMSALFFLLFSKKVSAFIRITTSVLLSIILIIIAISWIFIIT